jgi:ketosteroid isomerase-like protein
MSREDVEVVRGFIDAYNRRDADAVADFLHPDLSWHTLAGAVLGTEAVHGREAVLSFLFEEVLGALPDYYVANEETTELCDGEVLVVGRYEGRFATSGAAVTMHTAAIYRVDAGMITFFRDFRTSQEALEAARLEE